MKLKEYTLFYDCSNIECKYSDKAIQVVDVTTNINKKAPNCEVCGGFMVMDVKKSFYKLTNKNIRTNKKYKLNDNNRGGNKR